MGEIKIGKQFRTVKINYMPLCTGAASCRRHLFERLFWYILFSDEHNSMQISDWPRELVGDGVVR